MRKATATPKSARASNIWFLPPTRELRERTTREPVPKSSHRLLITSIWVLSCREITSPVMATKLLFTPRLVQHWTLTCYYDSQRGNRPIFYLRLWPGTYNSGQHPQTLLKKQFPPFWKCIHPYAIPDVRNIFFFSRTRTNIGLKMFFKSNNRCMWHDAYFELI